jgi:hypothetical protein
LKVRGTNHSPLTDSGTRLKAHAGQEKGYKALLYDDALDGTIKSLRGALSIPETPKFPRSKIGLQKWDMETYHVTLLDRGRVKES